LQFSEGQFFANNDNGVAGFMVSSDGVNWQRTDLPGEVFGLARVNGQYVATVFGVGGGGSAVYLSSNGTNWSRQPITVTPDSDPSGSAYRQDAIASVCVVDNQLVAEGTFYDASNYNGYGAGALYTSLDGVHWVRRFNSARDPYNPVSPFAGLAYGAGTVVAVGDGGLVLQSDVILPPPATITSIAVGSEVTLMISGPVGRNCRLETADALDGTPVWTPLKTVLLEQGLTTFTDQVAAGVAQRFYRVVTLP